MSKVDGIPALMELTVYGGQANPGGTFAKLVSLLSALPSLLSVSPFVPTPFLSASSLCPVLDLGELF